jgi:hypothetical protein
MSTLNVSNITDGTTTVGTSYVVNGSAKAWTYFKGDGTAAIQNSLNTSSLTDVSTGTYQLNWSSSFSNALYTQLGGKHALSTLTGNGFNFHSSTASVSNSGQFNAIENNTQADSDKITTSHHGDLA